MIGIYKITNQINQHCYIGQSINIERRWNRHKNFEEDCKDYPLYRAFKKYGIENFTFSVIEECSVKELDSKEIYWISYYNSYKNGYNQTLGGQGMKGKGVKLTIDDVEEIEDFLIYSNLNQSEIASHFKVSTEMVQGINTGRYWFRPEKKYPLHLYKNIQKEFLCLNCGKIIGRQSTYCPECAHLLSRKTKRPDKNILAEEIAQNGFEAVGRKYGVSGNAIKKWCDTYGLPRLKKEIKEYVERLKI